MSGRIEIVLARPAGTAEREAGPVGPLESERAEVRLDFWSSSADPMGVLDRCAIAARGSRGTGLLMLSALLLQADVVINEIHYELADEGTGSEFVELYNTGHEEADLGGWFLSEAVFFELPAGTRLKAGEYLVIAEDPERVRAAWGVAALGPLDGRLSNDGERLVLRDSEGNERDRVEYGVGFPWPTASAGSGASMELIHAALDNDLGGSWRASLVPETEAGWPEDPVYLVRRRTYGWSHFPGTSPPSDPPTAWRQPGFKAKQTWRVGRGGFGYGGDDDFTDLADMRGRYSTVFLRREFALDDPATVPALRLRVYTDQGCIAWLNGIEVARFHVIPEEPGFDEVSGVPARPARWEEVAWTQLTMPALRRGTNVLAVQALAEQRQPASFSVDAELVVPPARGLPSPGRVNSVHAERTPPQLRQVAHEPVRPRSGDSLRVTVKATDPDGVHEVRLRYQIVPPGQYLPAFLPVPHDTLLAAPDTPRRPNPAFEDPANWTEVRMRDDGMAGDVGAGDDVYTAWIPAQAHRTLVRYRITATDRGQPPAEVAVPYRDDRSLNFAAFVHDGVPAYRPARHTVHPEGLGHAYSAEVMSALPVYHLLAREEDVAQAHAWDPAHRLHQWLIYPEEHHPAFSVFNWEGTLVYEDEVYDHIRFRLRQDNSRYGPRGKRSLRFRFNVGHRFQARDEVGRPYPVRWRTLNLGKMSDLFEVGDYGLPEWINYRLWNLTGVPAPWAFHAQLRVVDGVEEAPATLDGQYHGDFWGMYLAVEDYDAAFVAAHGLPDGNLYKLAAYVLDGTRLERRRATDAGPDGDADFQNVWRHVNNTQPETWLRAHINYPLWHRYFAVASAVRHFDYGPAPSHNKNQAWFFEPSPETPYGRLWVLPWDTDLSWGPGFSEHGGDYPASAMLYSKLPGPTRLRFEFRKVLREMRQLLWQPEVINPMLDRQVALLRELSLAERDRWRGAPNGFDDAPIEAKAEDMKNFAFVGWQGTNGPPVGEGGMAARLDREICEEWDCRLEPEPPVIAYAGPPGYPVDALWFETTPPPEDGSGAPIEGIRWRVAEVNADPSLPPLEWNRLWESRLLPISTGAFALPSQHLRRGALYRVRAQVTAAEGRSSRWSDPIQFIAGAPQDPVDWAAILRVTEVMYHAPGGAEFDYLEIMNVSLGAVDLSTISIEGSVQFRFAEGAVTVLGPLERLVVVEDLACFRQRYRGPAVRVAGQYSGALPNSSGEISLVDSLTGTFLRCPYDDGWHPTTDGRGYALVLRDPLAPQASGLGRAGWQASAEYLGSPGSGRDTFDRDEDGIPDSWELQYGLDAANRADATSDRDEDGYTELEEYLAATDPQNPESALRLTQRLSETGMRIEYWTAPPGGAEDTHGTRWYSLERRVLPSESWEPVRSPEPSTGEAVVVVVPLRDEDRPTFFRVRLWFEP